jgi:hypothetical protein
MCVQILANHWTARVTRDVIAGASGESQMIKMLVAPGALLEAARSLAAAMATSICVILIGGLLWLSRFAGWIVDIVMYCLPYAPGCLLCCFAAPNVKKATTAWKAAVTNSPFNSGKRLNK